MLSGVNYQLPPCSKPFTGSQSPNAFSTRFCPSATNLSTTLLLSTSQMHSTSTHPHAPSALPVTPSAYASHAPNSTLLVPAPSQCSGPLPGTPYHSHSARNPHSAPSSLHSRHTSSNCLTSKTHPDHPSAVHTVKLLL